MGRLKRTYWNLRKGCYLDAVGEIARDSLLGDTIYTAMRHRAKYGRYPAIWRPKRFRDRVLRIMFSRDGRSDIRARITDKEFAKDFIRERLGAGFTAKTYAVLHSKDELAQFEFPPNCAIKATHDSGGVVLRRNGSAVDKAEIARWFDRNYYRVAREPNYRSLQPKTIVEELLSMPGSEYLPDYRFFCFCGTPAFVQVDVGHVSVRRRTLFSPKWNELDFRITYPRPDKAMVAPSGLIEMLSAAKTLSAGFSFLRVDFFQVENRIVVGELTNFPAAAYMTFSPESAAFKAGTLFDRPDQDCESLFGVFDPSAAEYGNP